MTTEAQANANRQNAQKSTGPKTLAGKARSALNALKHGFRSRIVLAESDPKEAAAYADFLQDFVAALQPVGLLESLAVETMALAEWRKRLVLVKEIALQQEIDPEDYDRYYNTPSDCTTNRAPAFPEGLVRPNQLVPLLRYEAHLSREYRYAFRQLKDLQSARLANPLPSPLVPSSNHVLPNEANPPAPIVGELVDAATSVPRPSRCSVALSPVSTPLNRSVPTEPNPVYPANPCESVPSVVSSSTVPNEANVAALLASRLSPTGATHLQPGPSAPGLVFSPALVTLSSARFPRQSPLDSVASHPFMPEGHLPVRCISTDPAFPILPNEANPPSTVVGNLVDVATSVPRPSPISVSGAVSAIPIVPNPFVPNEPNPVYPVHPCESRPLLSPAWQPGIL